MATNSRAAQALTPYVPRLVADWGVHHDGERYRVVEGSLLSADISGFTALSERLATRGKEGSEELTALLNRCFEGMIAAESVHGGDVLKFGGDAILVLFTGSAHAQRACAAAVAMRSLIATPLQTKRSGRVQLKMSQGIHSGAFTFYLCRGEHRELIVTGRSATATVDCEAEANASEILLSAGAAAMVDSSWLGDAKGSGRLLHRRSIALEPAVDLREPIGSSECLEQFIPPAQREQISAGIGGEHRQATVGFVKFAHTDGLDADTMADRLQQLVDVVEDAGRTHGVHWLATDVYPDGGKFILTAGVPSSSGNDEDDMLHAARRIIDAGLPLDLHIGVNRGPVFVGDLGATTRRTYTVMGDAVNLAARLMQKAGAGQLIASASVLDRALTNYATTPLEPFPVKGKSALINASAVEGPLDSRRSNAVVEAPFVGREQELATLNAAMDAALDHRGYAVELVGEPGIGKSRLIAHFFATRQPAVVRKITGGNYLKATPYLAVRPLLRSFIGVGQMESSVDTGLALTAWINEHAQPLAPWLPLLAIPFDATVASTPEADRIAPEFRRARLQSALLSFVRQAGGEHGVLLVEDAHLLDDATHELLVQLVGEGGRQRWLIVIARRPGSAVLPESAGAITIELHALAPSDASSLAADIARNAGLSDADLRLLAGRAGGNPLFVIELVNDALSRGSTAELPHSIEAVITSRIDTLAAGDRLLLRDAAVLGAMVDITVLAEALGEADVATARRWEPLESFLERDGNGLRFRHLLFQQVAYEGLSYGRRERIHRVVGETLERRTADPATIAGLLSIHFHRAGESARSCRYSLMAGDDARAKYANVEAFEFYRRYLDSAREAAIPPAELSRVAETFGDVSELIGRYDAADEAYARARSLTAEQFDSVRLMRKQGMLRERSGHYTSALRWFSRAMRAADAQSEAQAVNRVELALAYGGVRYRQGKYRDTVRWTKQAARQAEAIGEKAALAHALDLMDLALIYWTKGDRDHEPGASLVMYEELGDLIGQSSVLNNLGIAAYQAGSWDQAKELYKRSQARSEEAGDINGALIALFNLAEIEHDQGLVDEARRALLEVRTAWRESRYAIGMAVATLHLGRTEMRAGNLPEALELLGSAAEQCEAVHARGLVLDSKLRIAECLTDLGRYSEASTVADQLGSRLSGGADPLLHIGTLRIRGRIASARGDLEAAFDLICEAVERATDAHAPYERAESLIALAAVHDARGMASAAGEVRQVASSILTDLGVIDRDRLLVRAP